MGAESWDNKEVVILGRTLRWTREGIEFEAESRHRKLVLEAFGLDENSKGLVQNCDKEDKVEECDSEEMVREEVMEFREWQLD